MQIKGEKMITNPCRTTTPSIVVETQLKLPTFKLHDHAKPSIAAKTKLKLPTFKLHEHANLDRSLNSRKSECCTNR